MGNLAHPVLDNLLLEPNLLSPGLKPLGEVEIDRNNPLSFGMTHFYIFNRHGVAIDLVSGTIDGLPSNVTASILSPDGSVCSFSNAGITTSVSEIPSNEITILSRAYYNNGTQDHGVLDYGNQNPLLWADTISSSLYGSFYAGSTQTWVGKTIPTNQWTTWGVKAVSGTRTQFYIDKVFGSIQGSPGGFSTGSEVMYLGKGYFSGDNKQTNGFYSYIASWRRELSDAEFVSFELNPYQVLKPIGSALIATLGVSPGATIPAFLPNRQLSLRTRYM